MGRITFAAAYVFSKRIGNARVMKQCVGFLQPLLQQKSNNELLNYMSLSTKNKHQVLDENTFVVNLCPRKQQNVCRSSRTEPDIFVRS